MKMDPKRLSGSILTEQLLEFLASQGRRPNYETRLWLERETGVSVAVSKRILQGENRKPNALIKRKLQDFMNAQRTSGACPTDKSTPLARLIQLS